MKKLLLNFNLFITFLVVLGLSYAANITGISTQGTAFVYLIAILILMTSLRIFLGVTINEYKTSKLLVIVFMIALFGITLLASYTSIKILDVDFGTAFQLITFGIAIHTIRKVPIILTEKNYI